jgi:NitT/TauT family transport system ATP-binding protein
MAGLLEILAALGGREDLPDLAHELNFEVDDLLPLVDAVVLLGFATVDQADLELTATGRTWVAADILTSKQLFAQQARERAPLVRAITRSLATTNDGTLNERFFLDLLRRGFSEEEARRQLDTAIDWGRYAELFDYDTETGELTLEPTTAQPTTPA